MLTSQLLHCRFHLMCDSLSTKQQHPEYKHRTAAELLKAPLRSCVKGQALFDACGALDNTVRAKWIWVNLIVVLFFSLFVLLLFSCLTFSLPTSGEQLNPQSKSFYPMHLIPNSNLPLNSNCQSRNLFPGVRHLTLSAIETWEVVFFFYSGKEFKPWPL